jgi:hypothetical protein
MHGMKHFLVATLLTLVAACSDLHRSPGEPQPVVPGTIESTAPVERAIPVAEPDDGDDDPAPVFGDRLVVRLNDGRTVFLVNTGPRHFHTGQVVRVYVSDSSIFIL